MRQRPSCRRVRSRYASHRQVSIACSLCLSQSYYKNKIEQAEIAINKRTQNLRRLEAQRNALNSRVRLLREELKLLQEPGSYVGEVVKVMGKKKVLVKVQPEGKYGEYRATYRYAPR